MADREDSGGVPERRKVTIEIANLTEAQAIALEDLLAEWVRLGSWGCSRWTCFFADGDGNFRPEIHVNGHKPRFTDLVARGALWSGGVDAEGEYRIDFDAIAWRLRELAERSGKQR